MKNHVVSIGIGCVLGVVGLLLWQEAGGVEVPVVSLTTAGKVLALLGGVEVVISGVALARPATRHEHRRL